MQLLEKDPNRRLGGGPDDAEEVKTHPIFYNINWHMLNKKQIKPPYKPKIESEADTSNFDPMFTNATPIDSLPNTSSAPLSDTLQQNFEGFTYTNEMSTQVFFFKKKKKKKLLNLILASIISINIQLKLFFLIIISINYLLY